MLKLGYQGRTYAWHDLSAATYLEAGQIRQTFDVMGVKTSIVELILDREEGRITEDLLLAQFLLGKIREDGGFDREEVLKLAISDIDIINEVDEPEEEAPLAEPSEPESASPIAKRKKTAGASST